MTARLLMGCARSSCGRLRVIVAWAWIGLNVRWLSAINIMESLLKCRYWAILMCLQLSIVSNVYAQPAQESPPAQENAAGGDVRVTKAPKLIREVQAEYPEAAIEARVEGRVVLQLELDALGAVKSVEVLEGPGYGLNEAAAEAARQFEFEPAEVNGQPSAV